MSRFVGLHVQVTGTKSQYLYSGFIVELESSEWAWATAGHCATDIVATKEIHCTEELHFKLWNLAPGSQYVKYVMVSPPQINFINYREAALEFQPLHDDIITKDQAENFDVALLPLANHVKCYLISKGVKPFVSSEIVNVNAWLESKSNHVDDFVVVGAIGANQQLTGDRGTVALDVIPLSWGTGSADCSYEYPLLWIPLREFSGEVLGMSGGPVIAISHGDIRLFGIQCKSRPRTSSGDRRVGILPAMNIIEVTEQSLKQST